MGHTWVVEIQLSGAELLNEASRRHKEQNNEFVSVRKNIH